MSCSNISFIRLKRDIELQKAYFTLQSYKKTQVSTQRLQIEIREIKEKNINCSRNPCTTIHNLLTSSHYSIIKNTNIKNL